MMTTEVQTERFRGEFPMGFQCQAEGFERLPWFNATVLAVGMAAGLAWFCDTPKAMETVRAALPSPPRLVLPTPCCAPLKHRVLRSHF